MAPLLHLWLWQTCPWPVAVLLSGLLHVSPEPAGTDPLCCAGAPSLGGLQAGSGQHLKWVALQEHWGLPARRSTIILFPYKINMNDSFVVWKTLQQAKDKHSFSKWLFTNSQWAWWLSQRSRGNWTWRSPGRDCHRCLWRGPGPEGQRASQAAGRSSGMSSSYC